MQSKYLHCDITNCSTFNFRQGKEPLTHRKNTLFQTKQEIYQNSKH